jgi:hypothetical protein
VAARVIEVVPLERRPTETKLFKPFVEIEQVSALPTLENRAELCPEKLLRLERHDIGPSLMPAACEFKRTGLKSLKVFHGKVTMTSISAGPATA